VNLAIVPEQLQVGAALIEYETFEGSATLESNFRANRARSLARAERAQKANQIAHLAIRKTWRCGHTGGGQTLPDDGHQLVV
jgi:hypothetical protein